MIRLVFRVYVEYTDMIRIPIDRLPRDPQRRKLGSLVWREGTFEDLEKNVVTNVLNKVGHLSETRRFEEFNRAERPMRCSTLKIKLHPLPVGEHPRRNRLLGEIK